MGRAPHHGSGDPVRATHCSEAARAIHFSVAPTKPDPGESPHQRSPPGCARLTPSANRPGAEKDQRPRPHPPRPAASGAAHPPGAGHPNRRGRACQPGRHHQEETATRLTASRHEDRRAWKARKHPRQPRGSTGKPPEATTTPDQPTPEASRSQATDRHTAHPACRAAWVSHPGGGLRESPAGAAAADPSPSRTG